MGLISKNTRWFFILPSSKEAEERHIYDVAFGIKVLLSKGIDYTKISVIIDNYSKVKLIAVFSQFALEIPNKIYKLSDLPNILENNKSKNGVVFVTGHGSPEGLDSAPPMKPFPLYKQFQTTKNFKRVIFYFGQCYAGIFNQMPLSTRLGLNIKSKCSMVAIGSTGLFSSISYPITINNSICWSANVFLSSVFSWISTSNDIDGDEKLSVMDSFKSASISTNETLISIKKKDNISSLMQQAQLVKCIEKLQSKDISSDDKNNIILEIQALEKMLEIRYITQEPWILNASVAMNTEF